MNDDHMTEYQCRLFSFRQVSVFLLVILLNSTLSSRLVVYGSNFVEPLAIDINWFHQIIGSGFIAL